MRKPCRPLNKHQHSQYIRSRFGSRHGVICCAPSLSPYLNMPCYDSGYVAISASDTVNPVTAWYCKPKLVSGYQFVSLDRGCTRFANYVSGDYTMMEYLVKLRNDKTEDLMKIVDNNGDGMADTEVDRPLKRPRKELVDEIDDVCVVSARCNDGSTYAVRVCTSSSHRAKLQIELTSASLELLLKEPVDPVLPEPRPESTQPNVKWAPARHAVLTKYFDKDSQTWKTKSMQVKREGNLQANADKVMKVLQEFWNSHHAHDRT